MTNTIQTAEVVLPTADLKMELPFFMDRLGFRLEKIYPADDPNVAVLSGYGLRLRLELGALQAPQMIRLACDEPTLFADGALELQAPNGTRIQLVEANPAMVQPQTQHSFAVRHLTVSDAWVIGRAGMHYRDLIPDRLGGSIIASHIRIPDGGPVPDMVHYHTIGFQLIFCYKGWVDLVYEDQGPPFRLSANDCVIQPPEIRHKVLFASDNVEVIEVGVPAEHMTTIDHEMTLPNGLGDPERRWQGTKFLRAQAQDGIWKPWRMPGFEARDTGIGEATQGVAGVMIARPDASCAPVPTRHNADILFTFVKQGGLTLLVESEESKAIEAGDAFVIPPYLPVTYAQPTKDCELLEVALQADFKTDLLEHVRA